MNDVLSATIRTALALMCLAALGLPTAAAGRGLPAPRVQGPQEPPVAQGQNDYLVGRQDVLNIVVLEQRSLDGKYTVDADGAFAFPLLGRVKAAGLTLRQIEASLRIGLTDGYIKDPHISVTLDQFRGRRVFVFGGVAAPGMYPLGEGMTLIEILAKAGYPGASEVVVVRTPGATGPVMPNESGTSEVIRVNLRELEKDVEGGVLARNVVLQDADTIYVPRVDPNRVFVSGEVRNPGAFSIPDGTTVLQLLSLAGGVTEAASSGRIRIIRLVGQERKSIKATLDTIVKPGDTVVVPTRIF